MKLPTRFLIVKIPIYFYISFFLFVTSVSAQVGIGNTDPHESSMLDISSESHGVLIPRMTTVQREAIDDPANSLMVFDTNESAYFYYDEPSTNWIRINSSRDLRDNYVLVKSEADFPAPVGGVITLQTNTFYEINGLITLSNPINLNNACIAGLDANEDILQRTGGTIFQGSTGGSIRQVTLAGGGSGTAFNITGSSGERLLLQNTIISNMASVGIISGLGLFFSNIVQYSGNTTGITYSNIGNLLLSNQGWFGNNAGTYETFTGTFALIQKVSGFSTVASGATGINVSSNPTVGEGVMLSTLFTGAGTYVNRYTTGSYPGFNFSNNWVINCPGIPRESDNEATGNIYFNGTLATGFAQNIPTSINTPFNLDGNTTTLAPNNFRVTSPSNNRLTYQGRRTQTFQVNATLAVRANSSSTTNLFFSFYIRKNGTETLVPTNTVIRTPGASGAGSEIISLSISGTVELAPGEYIEIWGQRLTGAATISSPQLAIFAVNMNIK